MPEVKREIRSVGQRLSGLTAGDQFTFVLKRPKPRVDAENARRATSIVRDKLASAKRGIAALSAARAAAKQGNVEEALQAVDLAQSLLLALQGGLSDARDYSERAAQDESSALAEVKDAYKAAKDSADLAVQHADKVFEAFDHALRAVGAFVNEAASRG